MEKIQGIAVSSGIAIGEAFLVRKIELKIELTACEDPKLETAVFRQALQDAADQLDRTLQQAAEDSEEREILEAHQMMLTDAELAELVKEKIFRDRMKASRAVDEVMAQYRAMFECMEDEYMRARAADCDDIRMRLLYALDGTPDAMTIRLPGPCILVAEDILPSELLSLNRSMILGIVTGQGGATSHLAILAGGMGIPAVVGAAGIMQRARQSDMIILDGCSGLCLLQPTAEQLNHYRGLQENWLAEKEALQRLIGRPSVTKGGREVPLLANIGSPDDIACALENDAEGVGLFRTEFLFMDRSSMPAEEEQYLAYKKVSEAFPGRPVIIRTLDAGGDKRIDYLKIPEEMNPFLGYRAIRLCLDQPELFKVQLRALLRANEAGNIRIMFPMICTTEELQQARTLLEKARQELRDRGVPFREQIETGIMVETPAAAVSSDALAREADFFSIGTNDLIQYTMAADRMNPKVCYLYDPFHPSVQSLIRRIIESGHAAGIEVGLCGAAGGHPDMIPLLLEYGIDEISMTASDILRIRKVIRELD